MKYKVDVKGIEKGLATKVFVKTFRGESLMYLGSMPKYPKHHWCLGVGTVYRVKKGENVDLVYINFGKYTREILVINNHARRQIYTLKRGQLATYYGFYRMYKNKKGKVFSKFYAQGFNAWYVPKTMDIKRYDTTDLEHLENEQETDLSSFIDEIMKGV